MLSLKMKNLKFKTTFTKRKFLILGGSFSKSAIKSHRYLDMLSFEKGAALSTYQFKQFE